MKTIILYATKYGAAAEIAQRIASKIDGAVIHDLRQSVPSLADFDCVIIGTSVYAGMIRKEAKGFMSHNENLLREKKLGLFVCGMGADGEKTYFDNNFPSTLLQKAQAKSFLGGIFDPKKAGCLERFIMKIVTKKSTYMDTINDRKIEQFSEAMKA